MGRVTSSIIKELDNLNKNVVLIATTNLYKSIDKALSRRFDTVISFNKYEREDLIKISEFMLDKYLSNYPNLRKNKRLFYKILNLSKNIPYPGELKNIIKTSIAFSDISKPYDYLKRLFYSIRANDEDMKLEELKKERFYCKRNRNFDRSFKK